MATQVWKKTDSDAAEPCAGCFSLLHPREPLWLLGSRAYCVECAAARGAPTAKLALNQRARQQILGSIESLVRFLRTPRKK